MSLVTPSGLQRGTQPNTEEVLVTQVTANMAMSVDGFIADPDDGCDDLFGFYDNGSTDLRLADGWPTFHMDEPSATLFREAVARIGCHVVGRRLYDITDGWGGHPGNEAPMVVVTHEACLLYTSDAADE